MLRTIVAAILIAAAFTATAQDKERIFRPTQAAYLKGEIKKAQHEFVAKIAAISGVPQAKIMEWVPTDGRDVPPKLNLVAALQRERGKPFTEDERQKILAADQEHFDAIAKAKQEALKK